MSTVVYDGNGGGGELFAGLKFFILQRVPSRELWTKLVKANGGEIVKLEKSADFIVADHARKDCPPGSISWKWVEESVKQGRLQDLDAHRAGPAEHVVRSVGSLQSGRRHRVPFTHDDDQVLLKWVTKAERSGLSTKGNTIYEQLENINPRHTFQSWRDRWVKYVSRYPRSDVAEDDELEIPVAQPPRRSGIAVEIPANASSTARDVQSNQRQSVEGPNRPVQHTRAAPEQPDADLLVDQVAEPGSASAASPEEPLIAKSLGGYVFSAEELDLLHEAYEDIMNLSEDMIIDAWATWARLHPNHTAQEWHNCFYEIVLPQKKAEEESARSIETPAASETVPVELTSSPPIFTPAKLRDLLDDEVASTGTVSPRKGPRRIDSYMTDEKLFKKDVAGLAATLEPPELIDFNPKICGRPTSLFRLWQVVQSNEFGGYIEVNERNLWPQVARRMNFSDYLHSEAPVKLKSCYEEILADFEAYMLMEDEVEDLTESQEHALISQQLGLTAQPDNGNGEEQENDEGNENDERNIAEGDAEKEPLAVADDDAEEDEDDDLEAPSSMPRLTSLQKRKFVSEASSGDRQDSKHQRIDKGKGKAREIPSTPDDELNFTQRPSASYQPSPLKFSTYVEAEEDEEHDGLFRGPISKPNFGRSSGSSRERVREPETQDFHFSAQRADRMDPDSPLFVSSEERTKVFAENSPAPRNRDHTSSLGSPQLPSSIRRISSNSKKTPPQSAPVYSSSPPAQTDSSDLSGLTAFIERFVSLGYSQAVVIEALEATTMETGIAQLLMEGLTSGDGIPENMRGVWTAEDDEVVERGVRTGEEWLRVLKKHGLRRCNIRRSYLRDMRECRAR